MTVREANVVELLRIDTKFILFEIIAGLLLSTYCRLNTKLLKEIIQSITKETFCYNISARQDEKLKETQMKSKRF